MARVDTIAVIGAGAVGSFIAQLAALGGYATIVEDLLPNARRRAEGDIRFNLDRQVESGAILPTEAIAALDRLQYAGSVDEAARDADFVIEAGPEEMESKLEIFILLDKICRPGTILASHSSTLSITEIAGVTYRAQDCIGMRFSGMAEARSDVELIRAPQTNENTLVTSVEVARRLGLKPLVVEDKVGEGHRIVAK